MVQKESLGQSCRSDQGYFLYLKDYPEIALKNNKGHLISVGKIDINRIKKVIVYTPGEDFPEEKRQIKFYNNNSAGLIHLFHSEDYFWICKYLITPTEVEEYLDFRESFYKAQTNLVDHLPEQFILAHFLETLEVDHVEPKYINNLNNIDGDLPDFDISGLIENFMNGLTLTNSETEYYTISK